MRATIILAIALAGCLSAAPPTEEQAPDATADEVEPDSDERRAMGGQDHTPLDELNTTQWSDAYTGPGLGPFAVNTGCDPPIWEPGGPQVGGACLVPVAGTQHVEFTVQDDVSASVGIYVRTDVETHGFFCDRGSFSTSGAAWIMFVMDAGNGLCALGGGPGTPTTGTITATMYHT